MTQPDYQRFAIIPLDVGKPVPDDAICHGDRSAVMGRIKDSRTQREHLAIINDAEHARGTLHTIRARERDVKEREDAMDAREAALKHGLLKNMASKLDSLAARIDAIEAARAKDPDDDELPTPPGSSTANDDGDLEATKSLSRDYTEQAKVAVPLSYGNVHTEDQGGEFPVGVQSRPPARDIRKLAHPQDPPAQPIAIGD